MNIGKLKKLYMTALSVPIAKDKLLRRMLWQLRVRNSLDKYYVIHSEPLPVYNETFNKTIWWLWYQGSQNAPQIVKKCLESVRYYAGQMGYDVIELDARNLFDYVTIPMAIVNKWKAGNIGFANFSDIVRADLLANRGRLSENCRQ